MGLLDDAIREHLELKRRRGADPGEVAREQREALDDPYQRSPVEEDAGVLGAHELSGADSVAPEVLGEPDLVAGETAELDMQAVLAEDATRSGAAADEDSLEWEMPPSAGGSQPDEAPPSATVE